MFLETSIKIFAYGMLYFTNSYNVADAVIVFTNITIIFVKLFYDLDSLNSLDGTDDDRGAGRILRALSPLPVLRLCFCIEPLASLMGTFMCGVSSIGWLGFLILLVVYFFAVSITAVIGHDISFASDPSALGQYGTVDGSMYTLVTTGLGFPTNAEDLPGIDGLWVFFFLFYAVVSLGALNLIIGVLCEALAEQESNEEEDAKFERQERIDEMCSQLRAIFKQFKSAEDDTSTVDDLEDDLIGLNELVAFLEGSDTVEPALDEDGPLYELLEDAGVAPYSIVPALKMMPSVNGKINTELFMKEIFELNRPTTHLDILELKTALYRKSDEVYSFADQTHMKELEKRIVSLEKALTSKAEECVSTKLQLVEVTCLMTAKEQELSNVMRDLRDKDDDLRSKDKHCRTTADKLEAKIIEKANNRSFGGCFGADENDDGLSSALDAEEVAHVFATNAEDCQEVAVHEAGSK